MKPDAMNHIDQWSSGVEGSINTDPNSIKVFQHSFNETTGNKGRGQKKILVFFDFRSKGGGGLGQSKKSLAENTQIFLTKGGGVSPNPKGFYQIFLA